MLIMFVRTAFTRTAHNHSRSFRPYTTWLLWRLCFVNEFSSLSLKCAISVRIHHYYQVSSTTPFGNASECSLQTHQCIIIGEVEKVVEYLGVELGFSLPGSLVGAFIFHGWDLAKVDLSTYSTRNFRLHEIDNSSGLEAPHTTYYFYFCCTRELPRFPMTLMNERALSRHETILFAFHDKNSCQRFEGKAIGQENQSGSLGVLWHGGSVKSKFGWSHPDN